MHTQVALALHEPRTQIQLRSTLPDQQTTFTDSTLTMSWEQYYAHHGYFQNIYHPHVLEHQRTASQSTPSAYQNPFPPSSGPAGAYFYHHPNNLANTPSTSRDYTMTHGITPQPTTSTDSYGHPVQRPGSHSMPRHQHKVYNLYCAHCDSFLTDRGMRAVLLLRPSVTLYSTDAHSVNSGPMLHCGDSRASEFRDERSCDCLTEIIHCYGCGNMIGYHIIQPCVKCSSTVVERHSNATQANRNNGPNGHRFVFHSGEVTATPRRYRSGEPGVKRPQPTASTAHIPCHFAQTRPQVAQVSADARRSSVASDKELPLPEVDNPQGQGTTFPNRREPEDPRICRHENSICSYELREGDFVYWHQLANGGERAIPVDPATRPHSLPICGR